MKKLRNLQRELKSLESISSRKPCMKMNPRKKVCRRKLPPKITSSRKKLDRSRSDSMKSLKKVVLSITIKLEILSLLGFPSML